MRLMKRGSEDWKWMELAQDNWFSLEGTESFGSGTMVCLFYISVEQMIHTNDNHLNEENSWLI